MAPPPHTVIQRGRHIATLGERPLTSRLYELDGPPRHLVWSGPPRQIERIESAFDDNDLADNPAAPRPVASATLDDQPALVLECPPGRPEPFDTWKWRSLGPTHCVDALRALARLVGTLHRAGWSAGGLHRDDLLFVPGSKRLVVGAAPRLEPMDDTSETFWRDIRLFAKLTYENFLDHEYPGGHDLVDLLEDPDALAEADITTPGLSQLLAGCVTPYGDLAYRHVDDLLAGLDNLARELTRCPDIRVGSRSTQGIHIFRQNNQDACGHVLTDTTFGSRQTRLGFFCVADGIGGLDDGERASALAVQAACGAFWRARRRHSIAELRDHPVAFARAIAQVTSQRLALEGDLSPRNNRGGTTFTGLLIVDDRAGICHVGDSRAVLVRGSRCIPLTRDHTLATILEQLQDADPGDDEASDRTISRFFNTRAEVEYRRVDGIADTAAAELGLSTKQRTAEGFRIKPRDVFVLTTDGAHTALAPRRFRRLLALHRRDPQQLCESIVEHSILNVARDNATALAVSVQ